MSINNDYTTGSLSDFSYHQNYLKLIGTDLSSTVLFHKLILLET